MNRVASSLIRRLLLYAKVEKYVDGIASAKFEVKSSDGWIPKEIEVTGPLGIKPGLLRSKVCIDNPASIEIGQGGKISRIVVRLPAWVREALVQCLYTPFGSASSSSSAAASSSARNNNAHTEAIGSSLDGEVLVNERSAESGARTAFIGVGDVHHPATSHWHPAVQHSGDVSFEGTTSGQYPLEASDDELDHSVSVASAKFSPLHAWNGQQREVPQEHEKRLPGAKPKVTRIASTKEATTQLRTVVPPAPLHLPDQGGSSSASSKQCGQAKELERVSVEVHGLELHLRTYDDNELAEMRTEILGEALRFCVSKAQDILPEEPSIGDPPAAPPGSSSSSRAAATSPGPNDCEIPGETTMLNTLMQRIHENLCIECHNTNIFVSTPQADCIGHLHAERMDMTALLRPVRDRDEELWFGGRRGVPRSDKGTLEVNATGVEFRFGTKNNSGNYIEDPLLFHMPTWIMIAILSRPEGLGSSDLPPPTDDEGQPPQLNVRFAAPDGSRMILPSGPRSLVAMCTLISAIIAGSIACDPNTLAAKEVDHEHLTIEEQKMRDFVHLWWRDFNIRELASRSPDQNIKSTGGSSLSSIFKECPPCTAKMASLMLSPAEVQLLRVLSEELPMSVQAALLHFSDVPASKLSETSIKRLQKALCLAFLDLWPCSNITIATEFGGSFVLEIQHKDTSCQSDKSSESHTPRTPTPRAEDEDSLITNMMDEFCDQHDQLVGETIEVHFVGCGFYFSMLSNAYDWKKNSRLLMNGLSVISSRSGRPLLTCHQDPAGESPTSRGLSSVASFRTLVDAPPIAIESLSGSFFCGGRTGLPPWELNSVGIEATRPLLLSSGSFLMSSSQDVHEGTEEDESCPATSPRLPHDPLRESDISKESTSTDSRGRGVFPSVLAAWLDAPAQPPRTLFLRVSFQSPLDVEMWPAAHASLCALGPEFGTPGLSINTDFLDSNFPALASLVAQVAVRELSLKLQESEDTGDSCSITAKLTGHGSENGLQIIKEPVAADASQFCNENFTLKVALRGLSARCATAAGEVRPVLSSTELIQADYLTYAPGERRRTKLKVNISTPKLRLDISPQLSQVHQKLSADMAQHRKSPPEDENDDLVGTASAPARASANGPVADEAIPEAEMDMTMTQSELDSTFHVAELALSTGRTCVNLCDAISPLLRVVLELNVEAVVHKGAPPAEPLIELTGSIQVPQVTGEYASQKEGIWEPWLETWGFGVDLQYTRDQGLAVYAKDLESCPDMQTSTVGSGEKRTQSKNETNPGEGNPLRLNITPQLLRSAMWFSNQFQDTSQDNSKTAGNSHALPVSMNDRIFACAASPEAGTIECRPQGSEARIAARNFTGSALSVWFHNDRGLWAARKQAMKVHWENTEVKEKVPSKHEKLKGDGHSFPLDRYIDVPTETAVAIQLGPPVEFIAKPADNSESQQVAGKTKADDHMPQSDSSKSKTYSSSLASGKRWSTNSDSFPHAGLTTAVHFGGDGKPSMKIDRGPPVNDRGSQMLSTKATRMWPRRDDLPIFPLTTGWCVVLSHELALDMEMPLRSAHSSGKYVLDDIRGSLLDGWRKHEYVVQVLVPQPARRLVLIGAPFRIFNYTDRDLCLKFTCSNNDGVLEPVLYNRQLYQSATAPISALGTEQPYLDAQWLSLPPSPIGRTESSQEGAADCLEAGSWFLPMNSFCCVPTPSRFREEGCDFRFKMSCGGGTDDTWSQDIRPVALPPDQWLWACCKDNSSDCYFRILSVPVVHDKPYPVEILNIIILPAFSVVNVTPAVLAVDVREASAREMKRMCGCMGPRVLNENEDLAATQIQPGAAINLYHVNSSEGIIMHLCFPVDPGQIEQQSQWSEAIVLSDPNEGDTKRVEITFEAPYASPHVEVNCMTYVASISCPFWLTNHSSLVLHAGRNQKKFPVVHSIAMLDGINDIQLYLETDNRTHQPWRHSGTMAKIMLSGRKIYNKLRRTSFNRTSRVSAEALSQSGTSSFPTQSVQDDEPNGGVVVPTSTGGDTEGTGSQELGKSAVTFEEDVTRATSRESDKSWNSEPRESVLFSHEKSEKMPKCNLPLPVTSIANAGRFITEDRTYDFTVVREPLTSLYGELSTPTTCFHIVPMVMISNRTKQELQVRQCGSQHVLMKMQAGMSCPYWAASDSKDLRRRLQIQTTPNDVEPNADAWSGDIPCDSSASGRHAFAVRSWADDGTIQLLSVEISDALEGVISVSVSENACLIIASWSEAINYFSVETDSPADASDTPFPSRQQSRALNSGNSGRISHPPQRDTINNIKNMKIVQGMRQQGTFAAERIRGGAERIRDGAEGIAKKVQQAATNIKDNVKAAAPNLPKLNWSKGNDSEGPDSQTEASSWKFGGPDLKAGWPLEVGWYQPFNGSTKDATPNSNLVINLNWNMIKRPMIERVMSTEGSHYSLTSSKSLSRVSFQIESPSEHVRINISLARVRPLVVLRVLRNEEWKKIQGAVMFRILPRAQKAMEERARIKGREFRQMNHSQTRTSGPSMKQSPAERQKAAAARARHEEVLQCQEVWTRLSEGNPELLEITDLSLDKLGDMEVEWACGECGKDCKKIVSRKNKSLVPQRCQSCWATLLVDDKDEDEDDESTDAIQAFPSQKRQNEEGGEVQLDTSRVMSGPMFPSPKSQRSNMTLESDSTPAASLGGRVLVEVLLRRIDISVVSEKVRQELLFGQLVGLEYKMERRTGNESCRLSLQRARLDCQKRISDQHNLYLERQRCCNRFRKTLGVQGSVPLELLETPAIIASVGAPHNSELDEGLAEALNLSPCIEFVWERPTTEGVNITRSVFHNLRLQINHRWELVIDADAAQTALVLYTEIGNTMSQCDGQPESEAQKLFGAMLGAADEDFIKKLPPKIMPMYQVDSMYISRIEIGVWGSIVLSRLPTSAMPPSLVFMLKILALSDTISVEGSAAKFKEWELNNGLQGSWAEVSRILHHKYQKDMLIFLTKSLHSSNLLNLVPLLNPFNIVSACLAELMDVVDLSPLTLDQQYIEERRERKEEAVDSLHEGFVIAGKRLKDGALGMADVVKKPKQNYREQGLKGVPEGVALGVLGAVVKPLDAVFQSLRAFFQGLAAGCRGKIRKKNTKPSEKYSDNLQETLSEKRSSDRSSKRISNAGSRANSRSDPLLRGCECLRAPRLLFGDGPAVMPYIPWQAEILTKLGPQLACGICACWRIAGHEKDVVHLILCATHTELILVDLNRNSAYARNAQRERRGSKRVDHQTLQMLEMLKKSVDAMQKEKALENKRMAKMRTAMKHRESVRGGDQLIAANAAKVTVLDFARRGLTRMAGHAARATTGVTEVGRYIGARGQQRCCPCAGSDVNDDRGLLHDSGLKKVLGSWLWKDLRGVLIRDITADGEANDVPEIVVNGEEDDDNDSIGIGSRRSSAFESFQMNFMKTHTDSFNAAQRESFGNPAWVLRVVGNSGDFTEWPLPGRSITHECLSAICNDVNQAVAELGNTG